MIASPRRSSRRFGAGLIAVLLVAAALPGVARADPWIGPALVEPGADDPAPITAATLQAARAPLPGVTATAFAASDGATGRVLFGRAQDRPRAMASLTKLMTAVLALEAGNLDDVITVDVDYRRLGDSSAMGLTPGEQLSLRDLLYGLLLPSGNDAAIAIARYIGGSPAAFVERMNARAAELGLSSTHFANPHGLDEPGQYSTPLDLLALARFGMANPVFRQIVGTKETVVQGRATYRLVNSNRLLGAVPGVDGVKTGTTDDCGECLLLTAVRGGHRVYVVVLGSRARWDDGAALLDDVYRRYRWPAAQPVPGWGARLLAESGRRLAPATQTPPPVPDWPAALLDGEVWPAGEDAAWYRLWAAGEPLVTRDGGP